MIKNIKKRGFTLIELLVVIAIIGILSAVVLASLNQARSKGADAAAKSDLTGIRTQAALYYDTNSGYSTGATTVTAALTGTTAACIAATNHVFLDPNIAAQITAADKAEGGSGAPSLVKCAIDAATAPAKPTLWAVYVPLQNNPSGNNGWCVDSTGASKAEPTVAISGASCI